MDEVTLARATMGTSLGFHIVFAALGVGLPLLLATAEGLALWRRDAVWMDLARRWSGAFGLLFAIGAVSGTVLSFELGLLWPRFMALSGSMIGLPFTAEGFAFFVLWAWAVGQWPALVPPDLTIQNTAAPAATLSLLLVVVAAGMALLLPSLYLLFRVFKSRQPL